MSRNQDKKQIKPVPTPPCPGCQAVRTNPCGLMACVLRKHPTAGVPDGYQQDGRIDTRVKEWEE